ncbi:MAG: hypothetical protein JNK78_13060 [Planctomycetes bacterium]|nr:hypothetical protein [Planctomycetota bacterium]
MKLLTPLFSTLAAALLAGAASAQIVATTNATTDTIVGFSPVDGSLVSSDVISVAPTTSVSAIAVGLEIWVSEQTGDRVVRYDHGGNVLGVIGPTFPGGGLDNIRGIAFINNTVYVTNSGTANGAPGNAVVCFDTSGNYLFHFLTPNAPSPFSVMPWQGDILVTGSSNDDVHRYTLAGTSVGTFHNSTLSFTHQLAPASDGNVWCGVFTTGVVAKFDANTGLQLSSFPASGARGVFELQNGNVMWTNSSGVHIYDVGTSTSTQVFAGGSYHLNLLPTGVSFHKPYGAGCHAYVQDNSNFLQLFDTVPLAKAALDGNALRFTFTGNGYAATWLPGVAGSMYVPPTPAATVVADASATTTTFTPSAAIPVPGGTAASWTISSEGVLTAGSPGNQGSLSTVTLANTAAATGLAFYNWINQNPTEAGSGKIKTEEVGGVLCVTFDGVELASGTPTVAPSTYQWQIDMATGDVTMLWTSLSVSNSTSDMLVGCTLAGAGITPVSQVLSSANGHLIAPDGIQLPLQLSAAPPPVINPSTVSTYSITNLPEIAPGSGTYLWALLLSVNPLPAGFDLLGILTTVPGCSTYLSTWDIILSGVTLSPTAGVPITFSTPVFAPGDAIGAQAAALFDASFPLLNGEAGGFVFSNGVLSTTFVQ